MSWISDALGGYVSGLGNVYKGAIHGVTGGAGFSRNVEDFLQKEFIDKGSLRGAEVESVLSGLPLVGNMLKGVEGVQQLEDLYDNSGKIPQYPAAQNSGATGSGLGKSIPGLSRKIESGINDLFEFYTGEKDVTIESLHNQGILQYGDEI